MPKGFRINQFLLVVAVLLFQTPAATASGPPTLLSISLANGKPGQAVNVILLGTNFVQGDSAVAVSGTGVTSSAVQVVNDTVLFATLTITTTAASGDRNVTVTTPGGTSNTVVFTVTTGNVPTLTALSAPNGNLGQSVSVTLTGANFVSNATFINVTGNGVGVSAVNVTSGSSLTATLLISTGAGLGNHSVSVTTVAGTSGTLGFNVLGTPTLTNVVGASLLVGSTVNVNLTGSNFTFGATTVSLSGTGVTVNNNNVTNSTSTTARTINVTVAANATLGNRNVTVSTPGGTSAPFTISLIPSGGSTISTIAGKGSIIEGGVATAQSLAVIRDVARDSSGNLYIASPNANKVYKRTPAGALSTFAGTGIWGAGGDGGPGVNANLAAPLSVAVDASDNVYIAEGNEIRKVTTDGTISTFAGRGTQGNVGIGTAGLAGDGGPAVFAQLSTPAGLTFASGNLYVVDTGNNRIRKITSAGMISTVAGNGGFGFFGDGGPATGAMLSLDHDTAKLAIDGAGNLYIPDSGNHRIRMVTPGGMISTIAGTDMEGFGGDGGPASAATLGFPTAVAIDSDGNLYISDEENIRLRKIGTDGKINTVAGDGGFVFNGDGPDATMLHAGSWGLTTDPSKNVYFTDQQSNRVRMLATTGELSTLAGNTGVFSGEGGPATDARLYFPVGVAVDSADNVLIADAGNARVRSIDHSTGLITTIAGNGSFTVSGNNGPATAAGLGLPFDVAAGAGGVVYIAATDVELGGNDSRVWKIAGNGTISTIAGGSSSGFSGDNGPAASATLNDPQGIVADGSGNVYIADSNNNRVRRINASDGNIVTIAGNGAGGFSGDGGPATSAQVEHPTHLAVDPAGNLYITGQSNIRKVALDGTISTVFSFSGSAKGVAFLNGNIFVASDAQVFRLFDTGGNLPMAGSGGAGTAHGISGDNGPAIIASVDVEGIAVNSSGAVVFADPDDHAVRKITPLAPSSGQLAVLPASIFVRGGGLPSTTANMTVSPGGVFPWTATASVTMPGGENRLSVSPSSGTGFTTVGLTIDLTGLAAGTYNGSITFTSPNASNGSFIVPVTITVLPSIIGTNPQTLFINAPGGFVNPTVSVFNGGVGGNLDVSATSSVITPSGGSWLSLPTPSLTVGNFQSAGSLFPTINPTGLAVGTYTGTITLTATGAANSPATILVVLTVAAPNGSPTISSITPINGSQGETVGVTLTGNNFVNGGTTVSVLGTGVTVTSVTGISSTSIRATLAIAPNATLSTRTITATTSAGTTGIFNFNVLGAPTLSSVNPNAAGAGRTLNVNLAGTNLAQTAMSVAVSGTGVTMVGLTPSTSTTNRTVTLSIAPDAVPGNRSLTVSTPAGTTAPLVFTVSASPAYMISTIAGKSVIAEGGAATAQPLPPPTDVAFDSHGNLYVVVSNVNKVFKVTAAGVLTTFAGTGIAGPAGDGGPATLAQLNTPRSVVVDASDNVLIADASNQRIRKVALDGTITTFAGTGTSGFTGDGGPAPFANLSSPSGLGIDSTGNVYIADTNNRRIRKVNVAGIITTVAGNGTAGFFGDGLQAILAQLNLDTSQPQKLAIDSAGNIYIPDTSNQRIRKVAANGIISTIAGNGTSGFGGDGGPAPAALLSFPRAVLLDSGGNLIVSDGNNNRVRKIVNGTITTIAGNGGFGFNGDGSPATGQQLSTPLGLAMDGSGNLHIADQSSNRVRKVSPGGAMFTVAGTGGVFTGDSLPATATQLYNPNSAAFDLSGNLLIADSRNYRIRKVDSSGSITTSIGTGVNGTSSDGTLASSAQIGFVNSIAVDALGNLYFAASNRVRKVNISDGKVNTVAGTGVSGFSGDGFSALSAQLNNPQGIAVDATFNIYIADTNNNRVRKVNALDGTISTIAGTVTAGFSGDGGSATAAQLNSPRKVAIDGAGNIYIADNNNSRTRMIAPNQTISTFSTFGGRAVTVAGTSVFVASSQGIQQVASDGTPTTIAGLSFGFSGDNGPALMAAMNIVNLAVSATGTIYVMDDADNVVRKLTAVSAGSTLLSVSPLGINARLGNLSSNTFTETFTLNGDGVLTWEAASVTTPAGGEWLSISTPSGTGHGTSLSVVVNAGGLPVGFYSGSVTITSPQAVNGSVVVPVALTVLPAILSTSTSSLSAAATVGAPNPGQQSLNVTNGGSGPAFTFTAVPVFVTPPGGSWFSVSPGSGTTGIGSLTESFDITGLGSGIYSGSVMLTSAQAANSPLLIPVTLTVSPNAAPTLSLISPSSGNPGQVLTMTLTGTNFSPGGNTVNISGNDVTVGTVNFMSGTSLITTFTIGSTAAVGDRNVTVTTSNGTSTGRVFTLSALKKVHGQITSQ